MNILFFLKPKAEVACVFDYHTVRQAMEIMEYYQYSVVPILDKEGKYVGSISEGDILWGLKEQKVFHLKQAEDIAVMKLKRRLDYVPVNIHADMEDLVKKSMQQNFVPVVDDQEKFIGIVTRKDIIGYYYDRLDACTISRQRSMEE